MGSQELHTKKRIGYFNKIRGKHRTPQEMLIEDLSAISHAPATSGDYAYIRKEITLHFAGLPSKVIPLESNSRLIFAIPWRNSYILLNYLFGQKEIRLEKFATIQVTEDDLQTLIRYKGRMTILSRKRT